MLSQRCGLRWVTHSLHMLENKLFAFQLSHLFNQCRLGHEQKDIKWGHIPPATLSNSCNKSKNVYQLTSFEAPLRLFSKQHFGSDRLEGLVPGVIVSLLLPSSLLSWVPTSVISSRQIVTLRSSSRLPAFLAKPYIKACSDMRTGCVPQMFQGFLGTIAFLLVCLVCCSD